MAFITMDITEDTALITVVTTLLILFHTLITVSLQFSQIKRNGRGDDVKCRFQYRADKHHCRLYCIFNTLPNACEE